MYRLIISLLALLLTGTTIRAQDFVPFIIPLEQHPDSKIRYNHQPLNEKDKLSVIGEKFITHDGREVRIWGVNMSFASCFPKHSDAQLLAERLAGAGVNSVRFHHMDTAQWPRGIWDQTGNKLHSEALDRLDYFIDQLAKCGIYSNINLHVGREHSANLEIPHPEDQELRYDKMISIFTPEIIKAQKNYARELLTHINKYRGTSYANDYAVGFVEITNENSLFMWSAAATLPNLPEYYASVLQGQYNKWLQKKYGNDKKLKTEWLSDNKPLGDNMLNNSELNIHNGQVTNWILEQHQQAKATISNIILQKKNCLKIKPKQIDHVSWHLQLNYRNLNLTEGESYSVSFYAAAAKPRELSVYVNQNHADWQNLGLAKINKLNQKWKRYEANFIANMDEDDARIGFSFGLDNTEFYLANIEMRPGVEYKLGKNESLITKNIRLYGEIESPARISDRMIFLAETEKAYFNEMYQIIKQELGCKANVTGTIVFGPLGLWAQSDMDYIDAHAYWQHPHFPGKPWDAGNWRISQDAMSDNPESSTLLELASERLAGKPFTVSEYNHPAPLDSQAECVPMIASWAARQDWNGIWLYTYSHSNNEWDRNYMNSFFDIDSNPAKWGFMRAGAAAFRQNTIDRIDSPRRFKLTQMGTPILDSLAKAHIKHDRNMKAFFNINMLDSLNEKGTWQNGLFIAGSPSCGVVAGNINNLNESIANYIVGEINIETPKSATIMITPIDNDSKYLIAACGRCENLNMQFSENRETVSKNWGHGPVQIEAVKGTIQIDHLEPSKWKYYALKPDGTIATEIPIINNTIYLDPKYKTMWYLLTKSANRQ